MIKTQVIGHLGKDAVINNVNGKTVINFSVAHTSSYKDAQGNKKENTIWVNCAWWLDRTTIAQYLVKGTQVFVEGEPQLDMYTNTQGIHIPQMRLRVKEVQLLGRKQDNQQQPVTNQNTNTAPAASDYNDVADDLPF